MQKKIIKFFGLKLFEVVKYDKDEAISTPKRRFKKPQGAILEYTPEEYERDKEREAIRKMEGKK